MAQMTPHPSTVTLHELPDPLPEQAEVVFVTNAVVRRRGGLRARAEQQHHRPVLAAVLSR